MPVKWCIEPDPVGLAFVRNELTNLMKAYIARNIYDDKGFYPIYLKTDKTFQKSLVEIMK
ncbi:MAG: hypothetical protein M9948_03840 [Lentimicrobium sp.]|nr:hypothetical protein [Lentimicrobium sp.]